MSTLKDCRDRTAEFFSFVETLKKQRLPTQNGSTKFTVPNRSESDRARLILPADHPQHHLMMKSEFTQHAASISKGIFQVAEKLEQLTKLAKQKSLFNDPVSDINKLTYVVKHDIQTLNADIETLQEKVHQSVVANNRQSLSNSSQIVSDLKSKLANTTKSFTDILEIRHKNMKESMTRRKAYEAAPTGRTLRKRNANVFGFEEEEPRGDEEAGGGAGGGGAPAGSLVLEMASAQPEYLESRAAAVESLESTITEVSKMYEKLVHLIQLQDEVTIRIDDNITQTLENVDKGHEALLAYFNRVSPSTWLIIKVFLVLILFAIFFVVFIA